MIHADMRISGDLPWLTQLACVSGRHTLLRTKRLRLQKAPCECLARFTSICLLWHRSNGTAPMAPLSQAVSNRQKKTQLSAYLRTENRF